MVHSISLVIGQITGLPDKIAAITQLVTVIAPPGGVTVSVHNVHGMRTVKRMIASTLVSPFQLKNY